MFTRLFALFSVIANSATNGFIHHDNYTTVGITPVNNCIQFTVGPGTGCDWMCTYCSNQLGTFNYYFTDGVCQYQTGGCVGNPIAGKTYTCCSA